MMFFFLVLSGLCRTLMHLYSMLKHACGCLVLTHWYNGLTLRNGRVVLIKFLLSCYRIDCNLLLMVE